MLPICRTFCKPGTVKEEDILIGKNNVYILKEFIGKGGFSKVAHCMRLDTEESVAVKVVKKDGLGKHEVSVLKKLRQLDPDKNNLVRFIEHFDHKGWLCLAFEMLDVDIEKFARSRPLCLSDIRIMAQQLLVALNTLKSVHLVHSDIKPKNIMLANNWWQPIRVKLIDFGLTSKVSRLRRGTIFQVPPYRAPEVILGLPLTEAIDMWSFGCVLAYMYLGRELYPACELEILKVIMQLQGPIEKRLLNSGWYTKQFFRELPHTKGSVWQLKKKCSHQYCRRSKRTIDDYLQFTSLDDIVKARKKGGNPEETEAFLNLLKQILVVNPKKRLTPNQALEHHFITGNHIPQDAEPSDKELKVPSFTFKKIPSKKNVGWKCASVTKLGDPLSTDKKRDACTKDEQPPTAETTKKASGSSKPTSSSVVGDISTTGLVEVKTSKKSFKRIQNFFSRLFRFNKVHAAK